MKEIIKERIKDLWKENYHHYIDDYQINGDGIYTTEAIEVAQDVAISYFENRTEYEINRDTELDVSQVDYVDFVMEAMSEVL